MRRRSFLKTGLTAGGLAALGIGTKPLLAHIPPHNFDRYDFGSGPPVHDRLYQGPFSADDYPSWNVVMALTPSREIVPNYGMGLIMCATKWGLPRRMGRHWRSRSRSW